MDGQGEAGSVETHTEGGGGAIGHFFVGAKVAAPAAAERDTS